MVTEKMRMEMKARKARAKAAQIVEMLILYVAFGLESIFFRKNKKESKTK